MQVVALMTALNTLALPLSCLADPSAPPPASLDLSSQERTLSAQISGAIRIGNMTRVVNVNDLVTPAESAALYQTHANGNQSLILGVNGNAIGGLLNITPQMSGSLLEKVIIPTGITAFSSADVLQIANSFTNSGNFYAITNNPSQVAATIAAQSIFNQSNAVLSTVLPPSAGIASANPRLGLVLDAVNELVNLGTISSAGDLTLTAGQHINNSAVLNGATAVTLSSPSITNSGSITTDAGNVTIRSETNNLWINNDGGIIQARVGSIDIAEPVSFANTKVELYGILTVICH